MPLSIQSSEKFARAIEARVAKSHCSYMEAVLEFCTNRGIEPEAVTPLLNDKIRTAIGEEARRLNMIRKMSEGLPL